MATADDGILNQSVTAARMHCRAAVAVIASRIYIFSYIFSYAQSYKCPLNFLQNRPGHIYSKYILNVA